MKRTLTPTTAGHHHHQHPAANPAAPAPILPARRPTLTVISQAVLDRVRGLERQHLGSALYRTRVEPLPTDPTDPAAAPAAAAP